MMDNDADVAIFPTFLQVRPRQGPRALIYQVFALAVETDRDCKVKVKAKLQTYFMSE